MPIHYKDYYQTLGLPRSASQEEVRRAFRRLARKYHPDVAHNDPAAEAQFKEINEAHEVLGDPDKREMYDGLGAGWAPGSEFRPPPGFTEHFGGSKSGGFGGEDVQFQFRGAGFSDFFEQLFGSTQPKRSGFAGRDFAESSAGLHDVESEIVVSLQEAVGGAVRPITVEREDICSDCFGTGRVNGRECFACAGRGKRTISETCQVRIPAGVREGQRLRLAGRGAKTGRGRGAGDLLLKVRFQKHPQLRVEEGCLACDLELAPWEAVLGTEVLVPTLKESVRIKVPAGAQPDQKLRVRGKGLPGPDGRAGDLLVKLKIGLPSKISEREKSLWEQLAQASRFDPRPLGR